MSGVPGGYDHAYLWRDGSMLDLGTLGGNRSGAHGVNDLSQVVGWAHTAGYDADTVAFLWEDGVMTSLGTFPGRTHSIAYGINNATQVVGTAEVRDNPFGGYMWHACLWEDGEITDLGALGGDRSEAAAISNSGLIAGQAHSADEKWHAFLYEDNAMIDLGTLGGPESAAFDVNDAGQVVGQARTTLGPAHAFLWDNGTMHDLGTLGGETSEARGINNMGQVVGTSDTPGLSGKHAFLYSEGVMIDLNDLLPEGSGWIVRMAWDINDAGQIAGYGSSPEGIQHGFLLTPIPEPATLALVAAGLLTFLVGRRKKR
jgi:probable HAF family extracellular repeat protein